jgi:CheY-like chemotaxis protein
MTGYGKLRDVAVSAHSRVVVLRGRVPSYYLKQVAQTAVLSLPGIDHVRNDLEVATQERPALKETTLNSTIVVVDDDRDTRCNMADLLSDRGYQVDTAENGSIALEMARERCYGLGLLDLWMPGMDGLTLCRRLRQLCPDMKAMLITAHLGPTLHQDANAAGAHRVLLKPIDAGKLMALIAQLLPGIDCDGAN